MTVVRPLFQLQKFLGLVLIFGEIFHLRCLMNFTVVLKSLLKKELGGECSLRDRNGKYVKIVVGDPEGKRLLGRFSYRWKDNIK